MRKNGKMLFLLVGIFPTMAFATPLESPQIGGQGFVAGISINTASAWEATRNAGTFLNLGPRLQWEEQSLWKAWEHGYIQHLPYLAQSDGAVIYPLGQITPILQTCPGNYSLIVLNRGVVPDKMLGAHTGYWNVETSVAGHHAIIAVSPIYPGLKSDLQVMATGPHGNLITYSIGLVSGSRRYTPRLSFYRAQQTVVNNPVVVLPTPNGSDPSQSIHLEHTARNPDAVHLSVNWEMQCVTGQCQKLMLAVVANTPNKTFVHFKRPQNTAPMILTRNRSGESGYIPSQLTQGGKTLVLDGDPYQIDLLSNGPDGDISEVRLIQKGGDR